MKGLDVPTSKAAEAVASGDCEQQHHLESLIRLDFKKSHLGKTLDDLKRRAPFARDAKGLLRDWMALARRREAESGRDNEWPRR